MKLNWNARRHDENVAALHKAEQDRNAQKAKSEAQTRINNIYHRWKRELLKNKPKTVPELVQRCYLLHDLVAKTCQHTPGMGDWRTFTMQMIEDKIGQIILTGAGEKNQIIEYLPPETRKNPNAMVLPEQAVFQTLEELGAVKFVAPFTRRAGFIGFLRNGLWIRALLKQKDGSLETEPVGICACGTAIAQLPTEDQMRKELKNEK